MARRPDTPCAVCGKLLFTGRGSLPQPTCQECRRANPKNSKTKSKAKIKGTQRFCKRCGIPLALTAGTHRLYCSLKCRMQRNCEVCDRLFWPHTQQRICSLECEWTIHPELKPKPKPKPPKITNVYTCQACGKQSTPADRWRAWCSYQCRVDGCGQRVIDLYSLACKHGWSGARWRELLVGYLRERDGDRCAICHRLVRFDLKSGVQGNKQGPSIDHVLPRSAGGDDDLNNLRLTHWGLSNLFCLVEG